MSRQATGTRAERRYAGKQAVKLADANRTITRRDSRNAAAIHTYDMTADQARHHIAGSASPRPVSWQGGDVTKAPAPQQDFEVHPNSGTASAGRLYSR